MESSNRLCSWTKTTLISLWIMAYFFLQGCASSTVTSQSAHDMDDATDRMNTFLGDASHSNLVASYQNTPQVIKAAVVGGAAGALVGGVTSGVGVVPGAAVGAIGGGAYGKYLDRHMTYKDQLENRGVQVITLGDQILLVIPSELMFDGMTPAITPQGYSTLDNVAELLRQHTKISVTITAYTSDSIAERISLALTKQQAENVMKALWQRDINTRFIYAVGGGGTHMVQKNCIDEQGGANYRVEITLEKLPV